MTKPTTDAGDSGKATFRALLQQAAPRMGLTSTAIDTLVGSAQLTAWRRGQSIVAAGDTSDLAGFVVDGAVRLVCEGPGTARMTALLAGPGRLFGIAPSLGARPRPRLFGAVAHVPSTVAMVSHDVTRAALAGLPPGDGMRLLLYSWNLLSVLLHDKCQLLLLPLRDRLLLELQVLAREFGRPCRDGVRIDVPLRHDDLAELVAATRAKVTHALGELRAQGMLGVVEARLVLRTPTGCRPTMPAFMRGVAMPSEFAVPPPIPAA